jgi:peptidylprolyl isomerase
MRSYRIFAIFLTFLSFTICISAWKLFNQLGKPLQHPVLKSNVPESSDSSSFPSSFLSNIPRPLTTLATAICLATGSISWLPANADRRLNAATAIGTKVNSDPESLLRFGLPISNPEARAVQASIEAIKQDLKLRRTQYAISDANNVQSQLTKYEPILIRATPSNHQGANRVLLQQLQEDLLPLKQAMTQEASVTSGSLQEREALDKAFAAQATLATHYTTFLENLLPDNFQFPSLPEEYQTILQTIPRLTKRATVEFVIIRNTNNNDNTDANANVFDVNGEVQQNIRLKMIIDGYNAPYTGGNFLDLVQKGFYNGLKVRTLYSTLNII